MPALENVVCTEGGTAFGAFEGYHCGDAAGKTGTAQVGKDKADNALFCGWTPVQPSPDPAVHQYVVCVVIEGAGYGGSSAAPVARRVMDAIRDCMPRDTDSLTAAPCNPPPVHYVPTNIQKD